MNQNIFMRLRHIILHLSLTLSTMLFSVEIEVDIPSDRTSTGQYLHGLISIRRPSQEKVDESRFQIDNLPLKTEFLQTEKEGSKSIDTYRFTFPNPGKGLHLLPAISAKIGGNEYRTAETAFSVADDKGDQPLRIQARFTPDGPLYIGQTAEIVYQIFFRGNIKLFRETFPLLNPEGFTKIGALNIRNTQNERYNIQEIRQKVQAVTSGTYHYPSTVLEGFLYQQAEGKGAFSAPVKAEIPGITVDIHPFPDEEAPPAFNDALGQYQMKLELLSSNKIAPGDSLKLRWTIIGKGPLNTVNLPDIGCQPGISGFFSNSDLPPVVKTEDSQKSFLLELSPLSLTVNEIPPLEFSYFDPYKKIYVTLRSKPFPLEIYPLEPDIAALEPNGNLSNNQRQPAQVDWTAALAENPKFHLAPPENITLRELKGLPHILWYLLLFPLGALFLWVQWKLKTHWEREAQKNIPVNSKAFLENASRCLDDPDSFFPQLQKTLMLRLYELNYIPTPTVPTQDLPKGSARTLLEQIELYRYGGHSAPPLDELFSQAEKIYRNL